MLRDFVTEGRKERERVLNGEEPRSEEERKQLKKEKKDKGILTMDDPILYWIMSIFAWVLAVIYYLIIYCVVIEEAPNEKEIEKQRLLRERRRQKQLEKSAQMNLPSKPSTTSPLIRRTLS